VVIQLTDHQIGDLIEIDLGKNMIQNHGDGKKYDLKPLGEVLPIIDAGGVFAYARKTNMI